jgi:uncharacterized membrane protein YfcA
MFETVSDLLGAGTLPGLLTLAVVTFVAGAVNAVAGGGTILTFPVLASILPADPGRMVTANATSTIGLWPGAIAGAWAYRDGRAGQPAWAGWLLVPSMVGAVTGTLLVLVLPPRMFELCVPWLILLAATLFAVQPRLSRLVVASSRPAEDGPGGTGGPASATRLGLAAMLQFLVGVYGGYFGAGIGILMLAVLGLLGLGDIHRLNAVKNVLGMAINGTAAILFAAGSLLGGATDVSWPHAAVMAVAAVLGGLAGAGVARRLPATLVRRFVAAVGFALAAYYFWRRG